MCLKITGYLMAATTILLFFVAPSISWITLFIFVAIKIVERRAKREAQEKQRHQELLLALAGRNSAANQQVVVNNPNDAAASVSTQAALLAQTALLAEMLKNVQGQQSAGNATTSATQPQDNGQQGG